ncbi:hypothetical protein BSL78_29602 [Apostichopus japonicus]|uniref:Uncharacterized protein n=1 Tax=Stichopus japonicus TaxID=307972 RepID=A0A2G8JCW6_STIJA|nr:hypothetical protein BSL78_29602 [Apostichopus japonicus]
MKNSFEDYYLRQVGRGLPVFTGYHHQRGHGLGGILGRLARSALPFLKSGAKTLGKQALYTGTEIMNDALQGEHIKTSAKRRLGQAGQRMVTSVLEGSTSRRKPLKRKAKPKTRQKTTNQASEEVSGYFRRVIIIIIITIMALVHNNSCECMKSELDLFTVPPTQTSIVKGNWIQYHPLTNITDTSPIQFSVQGSTEDYLDLSQTILHMVTLNDRLVTPSTNTYAYRAMMETLLSYGPEAKESQLTGSLFYKDTAGKMDSCNPNGDQQVVNEGLKARYEFVKKQKMLLGGVEMKMKLHRNKDAFCLLSSEANASFKVRIVDASLYVRHVKVHPEVALAHAKALEQGTAKYPINRVEVTSLSIPRGNLIFKRESLFLGNLPKRVVLGIVDTEAFNGAYNRNPFNFYHHHLNFLALYVDGEQLPWKPLRPSFTDDRYIMAYQTLYSGLNSMFSDKGNQISRSDYAKGYTLYAFDMTPDLASGGHFNLRKNGNVRLEMQFEHALTRSVNVVVYAEYDAVVEVDKTRNVFIDF